MTRTHMARVIMKLQNITICSHNDVFALSLPGKDDTHIYRKVHHTLSHVNMKKNSTSQWVWIHARFVVGIHCMQHILALIYSCVCRSHLMRDRNSSAAENVSAHLMSYLLAVRRRTRQDDVNTLLFMKASPT